MISCLAPVKESCDGTGVLISLTCLDAVQKGSDLVKVITKATATVERPFAITDGGPAGQSLICLQYIGMKDGRQKVLMIGFVFMGGSTCSATSIWLLLCRKR